MTKISIEYAIIIGNHHSPSKIDGLDFQIQWEADLLKKLTVLDKEREQEKIKRCIDDKLKTVTGKKRVYEHFILGQRSFIFF